MRHKAKKKYPSFESDTEMPQGTETPAAYSQFMTSVIDDVQDEIHRAVSIHGHIPTLHTAYGLLMEEVDEFWDEVKKKAENRTKLQIREELVQIAAIACRAVYDFTRPEA